MATGTDAEGIEMTRLVSERRSTPSRRLGGTITVDSGAGEGPEFTIDIPDAARETTDD